MTETAAKPATTLTREDVEALQEALAKFNLARPRGDVDCQRAFRDGWAARSALASQSLSREAEIRREVIEECAKVLKAMKIKTADADAGGGYRYNKIIDSAVASISIRALAQQPDKEP